MIADLRSSTCVRAVIAAAVLWAAGCSKQPEQVEKKPPRREQAPPVFRVKMETSKGDVVIEVIRDWAPHGADRFYELIDAGYYNGCRFFRMLPNFVVQWGINGDPAVSAIWRQSRILDDPVKQSNKRGTVTFATGGPNSRTTQVFINMRDKNTRLDESGFAPFGQVISGMEIVDRLYSGYGEGYPGGNGPRQDLIQTQGNAYLEREFPRLDYIRRATLVR